MDSSLGTSAGTLYSFGRIPSTGALKFRGIVLSDNINRVEYMLRVRGVNDPDDPGSWTDVMGAFVALAAGNAAICVSDITLATYFTVANFHELEFAITVRQTTGGSNASLGRVRVLGGVSY